VARLKIAQVATVDLSVRFLLIDHLQKLQELGHDVTAICSPGKWVEDVRSRGIRVLTIPMQRELSPAQDLRSLLALRRCFEEEKFDVVHTHTPKAGLLGPVAARLAGIPVIVHTIHGLLFHDQMKGSRRALFWLPEKWTATFATRILSQSREDVEVAVRTHVTSRSKIQYLGNGIDVRHFSGKTRVDRAEFTNGAIGPDDFVVGCVGRLVYDKGFRELFEAAEMLVPRFPNLKFVVIGPEESDQNDAIEPHRLKELKRRGIVHFLGWRDDTRSCYALMDAFALPSHREGVPRACMEAAAMKLPIVASNIRGCREIVVDGESGILVPVRNAARLAEAITRLMEDRDLCRRMGERGREHVCTNFDHRKVLDRLGNFYDAIEQKLRGHSVAQAAGEPRY
jgi:glycosyltransferase involved in cell wall biosynthesis